MRGKQKEYGRSEEPTLYYGVPPLAKYVFGQRLAVIISRMTGSPSRETVVGDAHSKRSQTSPEYLSYRDEATKAKTRTMWV